MTAGWFYFSFVALYLAHMQEEYQPPWPVRLFRAAGIQVGKSSVLDGSHAGKT